MKDYIAENDNKEPSIKFTKRKTKSNIRFGVKVLYIVFLAGFSGAFFSNILIEYKYRSMVNNNINNGINENMVILDYTQVANNISSSLVGIYNNQGNLIDNKFNADSTGIILDESGIILTSYSGLNDLYNIYVKLQNPGVKPIKAEYIGGDENIDVAFLKITTEEHLKSVNLAKMDDIKTGQDIAIISNPTGDGYVGSITPGIITSIYITLNKSEYKLLQVSAPINQSNNGGAICNSKGELVGIASYSITSKMNEDKFYYAIDLRELESLISNITKFKDTLGLVGGSIVKSKNSDIQGFYVKGVKKYSLADRAGIEPTDIIIEIDGIDILNSNDIQKYAENKKTGDKITLKVVNAGREREVKIEF